MDKIIQRYIEVYADWIGLSQPTLMGILYATAARGKEIFSFTYNEQWLKSGHAHIKQRARSHGASFSSCQYLMAEFF